MSAIVSHHRRGLQLRSCGGEQLVGVPEQLLGLVQVAAGDQVAGLLGDDPGLVERAGSLLVPGFGLLDGPVQQGLARLAVAAGEGGISRLPQQVERHGLAVAVQQRDRVLAELERLGGRAAAQRGDGAGGAGGGDGRVIGEQGEPGQLQIQRQHPGRAVVRGRPRPRTAARRATAARAACSPGLSGSSAPGGQGVGGQGQAGRVVQVRVGVQQPQAPQPGRRPAHLAGEHVDHRFGHRQVEQRDRPQQRAVGRPGLVQQGVEGQVFQELPHLGVGGQVALAQVGFHAGDRGLGPVQARPARRRPAAGRSGPAGRGCPG